MPAIRRCVNPRLRLYVYFPWVYVQNGSFGCMSAFRRTFEASGPGKVNYSTGTGMKLSDLLARQHITRPGRCERIHPFSSTGFARSTRVARGGPLDSRSLWTRLRAASARPRCSRRSSIRIRGNRARNPAQARNRESAHGCGTVRAPLGPRPPRWPCGLARGRGPATPCRRDGPCERRGRV
jgi:hypothetical protein